MKRILICLAILCLVTFSNYAQQVKYKIIYQDTINLRGIVYDAMGKPVSNAGVASRNMSLKGTGMLYAVTDSAGKFRLLGAKPNDTITIWEAGYTKIVYNKGSRYMEITMPPVNPIQIEPQEPIVISAVGKPARRKIPVRIEINDEPCLDCGGTIEQQAEFPGGLDKFSKYIRSRLQYPPKAAANGIEGTVEVAFWVMRDGSVTNFRVLHGIGYGCDEAVIALIKAAPKWKPAMAAGRVLITPVTISMAFKLKAE